jgi:hypothetical protein
MFGDVQRWPPGHLDSHAGVAQVLAPSGEDAKIEALLKAGGFGFSFSAPGAGRLMLSWYELLRKGAHLATAMNPAGRVARSRAPP